MFAFDVTFVADHDALKNKVPPTTHRVVADGATDLDAMLTATQIVLARGVFVIDAQLIA